MTISVSNLGKRFNREWIFNGLTFQFSSGKVYAITGPNGSGKSTLMQVLWGQVPASMGELNYEIDGRVIPLEEAFQYVSIATPYMDLLEEFTLHEQVDFHFKFKGCEDGLNAGQVMEKMGLSAAANKPIKQFSSGMKQRVKLGLALFSTSKVVFLDEPTTNLDNQASAWYMQHLLAAASTKTILVATNLATDYPVGITILNLSDLKRVTQASAQGIQTR
jgi:ABC-type multidrug transport system ATPase subunit